MAINGTVRNGVVVFDAGLHLPEGSRVSVEVIQSEAISSHQITLSTQEAEIATHQGQCSDQSEVQANHRRDLSIMEEAEWFSSIEPSLMLFVVRGSAGERKLRLFGVACCRRICHVIEEELGHVAIEKTEAFADGRISRSEFNQLGVELEEHNHRVRWNPRMGQLDRSLGDFDPMEIAGIVAYPTVDPESAAS